MSPTGDYVFGNNSLDFYQDSPAAVGQSVMTRLLLFLGEWYLDTTQGTPFMEGILGKHTKAEADATIQDRVLSTDNVVSIDNYVSTIDPDTRAMTVQFDLNTIFGTTQIQLQNFIQF